jgi:hypothetical protein
MQKDMLKEEALKWRAWFQKGQKNWSAAHHTTIFGSIICSVVAGALLQITGSELKGYAAVLTSMAAALTSLAAAGGFERKWKSNRLSRSRIDGLLIDMEAENPNMSDLADQLKDIISKHDEEIVKTEATAAKVPAETDHVGIDTVGTKLRP